MCDECIIKAALDLGDCILSLSLTSFHHHDVDVFVQHHGAGQVELICIRFHFELLGWVRQVSDPEKKHRTALKAPDLRRPCASLVKPKTNI